MKLSKLLDGVVEVKWDVEVGGLTSDSRKVGREDLNRWSWKIVDRYLNIKVGDNRLVCPYFNNWIEGYFLELMRKVKVDEIKIDELHQLYVDRGVDYGWFRGKGTPEQIEESIIALAEEKGWNVFDAKEQGIVEFMRMFGLGIDCSGLVYNVLNFALQSVGLTGRLDEVLDYKNKKKTGVYRAGAFSFAGKASEIIAPKEVNSCDVICVKNKKGLYNHVALVLKRKGKMFVVQSVTMTADYPGVNVNGFEVIEGMPVFDFKPLLGDPWEKLYEDGRLEFRRLNL